MRGNVIGFDPGTNTGAVAGHDGNRYDFARADWRGSSRPRPGDVVDFQPEGQRASELYLVEAEYVAPGWAEAFFSFRGRFSRSDYWVKSIVLQAVGTGIYLLTFLLAIAAAGSVARAGSAGLAVAFLVVPGIVSLLILWPALAILVKRIHDREKSGWFALILYGPLILLYVSMAVLPVAVSVLIGIVFVGIGVWFFIEFGCLRGTVGANRYGPDPVFDLLMRVYGHMVTRTRF